MSTSVVDNYTYVLYVMMKICVGVDINIIC